MGWLDSVEHLASGAVGGGASLVEHAFSPSSEGHESHEPSEASPGSRVGGAQADNHPWLHAVEGAAQTGLDFLGNVTTVADPVVSAAGWALPHAVNALLPQAPEVPLPTPAPGVPRAIQPNLDAAHIAPGPLSEGEQVLRRGESLVQGVERTLAGADVALRSESIIHHELRGADALSHGDYETQEDEQGETELDFAGALIPGLDIVRAGYDAYEHHVGGPTAGQRLGRSGPHPDTASYEAEDLLERGIQTAPTATGGDSDRLRRNRAHEAEVQADMDADRVAQANRLHDDQNAARINAMDGSALNRNPIDQQAAHEQQVQRARDASIPEPTHEFQSVADPNMDPVAARYQPRTISLQ